MRKYLWIIAAALLIVSCGKKPAEQTAEGQEQPQEETVVENQVPQADLVGKTEYVLLDFWASWCGPCRRFVPVLKEIYASQPKGHLQILSCSVDQDMMAWRVALNEEQMPWPQIREDENHPCADKYNVQFIPHTVLIDKEGKIVGVNLEEPELEEILLGE